MMTFQILRDDSLSINLAKYQFFKKSVEYLGFKVDVEGLTLLMKILDKAFHQKIELSCKSSLV